MKTKTHLIQGCSLDRIEELASAIDYRVPDWVPYTVAIPGTETSALDEAMVETQHFSGLLRQLSRSEYVMEGHRLADEDGGLHDLGEILDDSAERLDQAHQEWLETQAKTDLLNDLEIEDLRMILMHFAEVDPDSGETVDNLWNKLRNAKVTVSGEPVRYEVQENTICDGWVNNWTLVGSSIDEPGTPETFDTLAGAMKAIAEHLRDIREAVAEGHMASVEHAENFRVREVRHD